MAITRLERKGKRNKSRAKNRVKQIKNLSSTPVIKNVDIEEIKKSFEKTATKKEAAPKKEKEAEIKPEVEVKHTESKEAAPKKEESPKKEKAPKAKATKTKAAKDSDKKED